MRWRMPSPTPCSVRPPWATSDATFQTPTSSFSLALLAEAARRVRAAGWKIANIDCTIVAEKPKMAPHVPAMRLRLGQAMTVQPDQVNIKAKTAEGMGPVGRGESIEARAVCLLMR